MPSTRTEHVASPDGGSFDARLTLPDGGPAPGIVLVQEVFGVNDYLHAVAERLAGMGYATLAPDLFWRIQPGISLPHTEESLTEAITYGQAFDAAGGLRDLAASLAHLRSLPEVAGGVGVLGFCLGGTLAYLLAAEADPDVAVSYYGSGVPAAVGRQDDIACPLLLHFGGSDPYIPRDGVAAVEAAVAGRPDVECVVQEGAGHAFDNHLAPMFTDPAAAAVAWERTADFLRRHLPTSAMADGTPAGPA